MSHQSEQPVVLFDGVCNLCNSTVSFLIKRDKNKVLRFAHLQTETAKSLLENHRSTLSEAEGYGGVDSSAWFGYAHQPTLTINSIVYIENNRVYIKSTAVLRILRRLKMPYPLLYALIIIPPFIRNAVYDIIAKNRYRWFGKSDTCIAPTDDVKERFYR